MHIPLCQPFPASRPMPPFAETRRPGEVSSLSDRRSGAQVPPPADGNGRRIDADPVEERSIDRRLRSRHRIPPDPACEHRCRTVRSLTVEMLALSADRVRLRRDRRESACKVRQIAMYVCHVALRMPMRDVGLGFGRDRTTVSHACNVVEDRRDEPHFDALVSAIERVATLVFATGERDDA